MSQIDKNTKSQCKILQIFYKNSIINHFYTQKIIRILQERVCRYFLNAALNFAMSFLRFVILGGKLLKICMPA